MCSIWFVQVFEKREDPREQDYQAMPPKSIYYGLSGRGTGVLTAVSLFDKLVVIASKSDMQDQQSGSEWQVLCSGWHSLTREPG